MQPVGQAYSMNINTYINYITLCLVYNVAAVKTPNVNEVSMYTTSEYYVG